MNLFRTKGHPIPPRRPRPHMPWVRRRTVIPVRDCLETLRRIPAGSIQFVVCDPPYNVNVAAWDDEADYVEWAAKWIRELERVLARPALEIPGETEGSHSRHTNP